MGEPLNLFQNLKTRIEIIIKVHKERDTVTILTQFLRPSNAVTPYPFSTHFFYSSNLHFSNWSRQQFRVYFNCQAYAVALCPMQKHQQYRSLNNVYMNWQTNITIATRNWNLNKQLSQGMTIAIQQVVQYYFNILSSNIVQKCPKT